MKTSLSFILFFTLIQCASATPHQRLVGENGFNKGAEFFFSQMDENPYIGPCNVEYKVLDNETSDRSFSLNIFKNGNRIVKNYIVKLTPIIARPDLSLSASYSFSGTELVMDLFGSSETLESVMIMMDRKSGGSRVKRRVFHYSSTYTGGGSLLRNSLALDRINYAGDVIHSNRLLKCMSN